MRRICALETWRNLKCIFSVFNDVLFVVWIYFLNCVLPMWFFFLLTGMYHVFLLIKDGFFHITNLALAKIETGIKTSCAVELKFCWSHFVDRRKNSFFFCHHSHWKNGCGSFERGKAVFFLCFYAKQFFFLFEQQKYNQTFPQLSSSLSSR